MQIHKKRIKKEDGRYLIYYTFTDTEEEKESKDVRAEMESHLEAMDNSSHSSTEQDFINLRKIIVFSVPQRKDAGVRFL
ncbi:MAG: hypothetical protein KAX30_08640 [Candidatus Atribacteria bacterium]|nr:hypothetical protein [Candidatus Atribacteria bacterium]